MGGSFMLVLPINSFGNILLPRVVSWTIIPPLVLDAEFLRTVAGINWAFTSYKLVLTTSICLILGKPENYRMSQLDCFPLCLDEEIEA